MNKVECKHNKNLVMTVLGRLTYGGVDYLILVDGAGVPEVFTASAWTRHVDPAVKAKAAEDVCQALIGYVDKEKPWTDVLKKLDVYDAA